MGVIYVCGHTPQKASLFRKILCWLEFHEWGGWLGDCKYCYANCATNQPWHWVFIDLYWTFLMWREPIELTEDDLDDGVHWTS